MKSRTGTPCSEINQQVDPAKNDRSDGNDIRGDLEIDHLFQVVWGSAVAFSSFRDPAGIGVTRASDSLFFEYPRRQGIQPSAAAVDCRQMIFHSQEVFPDAGKAYPQWKARLPKKTPERGAFSWFSGRKAVEKTSINKTWKSSFSPGWPTNRG